MIPDKVYIRTRAVVLASEKWADGYMQAPVQHAKQLKTTARLERKLITFFRDMAKDVNLLINWNAYTNAKHEIKASRITAYDVNVIVNDDAVEATNQAFITIVLDEVALAVALGAQAGEVIYSYPLHLDVADAEIQRRAREQVAKLVSKKIDIHGNLVDDTTPDAFKISDKTIKDIQESIRMSIDKGDDVQTASKRLQSVIRNPKRAQLIAQNEITQAYATGMHEFGIASGAIGKQWTDNGATDICATNTADGAIPFDKPYSGGVMHPRQHIGCKCYQRLIYQNELDDNPNLFN